MKSITKLILMILILFTCSFSCKQQGNGWKGTIEEENGVTTIKNPIDPMYGNNVFSLEEELTIGEPEGREEYMFSDAKGLAVSEDERIFVLDTKGCCIKVFDKEGHYLNSIGRKGQGPGEMQRPTGIQLTPHEQIMVNDYDAQQLLFFTLEGDFLRGASSAKMRNFVDPMIDSKGNIVASYSSPGRNFKSELKKFNSELEPILSLHSLVLFEMPVMNAFFPQFFWQITKEDYVIWGISTEYKLQILDSQGKLIKRIIKDHVPVEITEDDKQKKLKFLFGDAPVPQGINLKWPKHHWAFSHLSIDENGNIFLQTLNKIPGGNGYYYDVYDPDGRYIVKIPLAIKPLVWKKNKLYTIEEDEEGFQMVKRYKVTWSY